MFFEREPVNLCFFVGEFNQNSQEIGSDRWNVLVKCLT